MNISFQTVNCHTCDAMFKISCLILIAIIFSVHSMQRQFLYSILDKEVTNSSLAVPYGEVASRVYCAGLCSGDDYCMEFFYNTTSRQCIGLHCVKKGNYSYQFIAPAPLSMLYFGKGYIYIYTPWNQLLLI